MKKKETTNTISGKKADVNDDDHTIYQQNYAANLQLAALANECANNKNVRSKAKTAAVAALRLLEDLPAPDTVGYNSVRE